MFMNKQGVRRAYHICPPFEIGV